MQSVSEIRIVYYSEDYEVLPFDDADECIPDYVQEEAAEAFHRVEILLEDMGITPVNATAERYPLELVILLDPYVTPLFDYKARFKFLKKLEAFFNVSLYQVVTGQFDWQDTEPHVIYGIFKRTE